MSVKDQKRQIIIRKLKGAFAMILGILTYFSSPICLYIIFYGSSFSRIFLTFSLIYQYTIASRSQTYIQFISWLKPYNFFDKYEIIYEEEIKQERSLFCFHPHGVLGCGLAFASLVDKKFENACFCISGALLYIPLSGILARWMGAVPIDNNSFGNLMKKEKNLCFIPGGYEEATLTHPNLDRVYIKNRKGFVKYALKYGYTLHPIYNFGENKAFYTFNFLEKFRLWLNKFKIPCILFIGRYVFLPNDSIEMHCVIGKGIHLPTIENPSDKDINKYHDIYVEELGRLYDRHKSVYKGSDQLEIL